MPKMLKDMFDQLCMIVEQDECKIRKLETIGFLHSGLVMPILHMDSPAGYVCRVEFGKNTLPVIAMAWKAKVTDDSEEDQLQCLQGACDTTPPPLQKRKKVYLPTCLDTPSKPSKRIKETLFNPLRSSLASKT
nr:12784_t:CDS:2 [Entrophospora candida]